MNEIQIRNFDKRSNPTKDQLTILENANKCTKIIEFLELKTKNDKTRRTYGSIIRDYLVTLNIKDPNKYFIDPRKLSNGKKIDYTDKLEKDVLKFNKSLQTKSGSHRKTNLSAIRRFFEYNKIDLGNSFWEDTRKNGKKAERQTDTETPSTEQLKNILSRADTEGKAFFLTIMTSETGKPITKFITPEAKYFLEQYLKERNQILETRINRSNYIKHNEQQFRQKYNNRVFPMGNTNPETMWKNLLNKEKLYKIDPETKNPTMGIHSLRRYFEDNLGNGKLSKYLQNKTSKSEEPYQYKTQGKLEEEYKKYMINLYVFEETEETKAIIEETRKSMEEMKKDYENKIRQIEQAEKMKNKEYKKRFERMNELIKNIIPESALPGYPTHHTGTGIKDGKIYDTKYDEKQADIIKVSKSEQNQINKYREETKDPFPEYLKIYERIEKENPGLTDYNYHHMTCAEMDKNKKTKQIKSL